MGSDYDWGFPKVALGPDKVTFTQDMTSVLRDLSKRVIAHEEAHVEGILRRAWEAGRVDALREWHNEPRTSFGEWLAALKVSLLDGT